MCGYVGFFGCGNKEGLQNALLQIAHRGPDDEGVNWFDAHRTGLGHRRLSIIDLSPQGHQPMQLTGTPLWIIFNGEIYNYKEIKKELVSKGISFDTNSDTEVLLASYQYWGKECLERLNGMFSFVIYNAETNEVFAARDRLGIKPLYYLQTKHRLIIASEIKSILNSGEYKKEPDYSSLHTPVHYQTTPFTGFKDILKLPSGHLLEYKNKKTTIQPYWRLKVEQRGISESEAFEQLDSLLQESVRLQTIADVPVGLLLSGGLDSSIIGALMQKQTNQQVQSFTIKFKANDLKKQGNVDDSFYAKKVARAFNFKHQEIVIEPNIVDLLPKIIWHLDEPLADPAAINTYLICKAAREKNIIVLLNGMGGDEVFSGYRSHLACLKAQKYKQRTPAIAQKTLSGIARALPEATKKRNLKYVRWAKSFLAVASLSDFDRSVAIKNSALTHENFQAYYSNALHTYADSHHYTREREFFKLYNSDYLTQMCVNDTLVYMPDHNLTYTDKASMAASVECRPPLIDHNIVEFAFQLPPQLRIKRNTQKYILKRASEKYLDKDIIYRPKAPFSAPMRGWLKNELSEMIDDILSPTSLKNRGIYNPSFVAKLIRANKSGKSDNSQLVYRLLTNELWFRTFFD